MSIVSTTLQARNEFTTFVTSSVNCLLLDSQGELIRDFVVPDGTWDKIRISFRTMLIGSPSGSLFKGLLFAGVCSGKDHGWGNFGNEHCVGTVIKGNAGTNVGPPGKQPFDMETKTNANTDPPNINVGFGQSILGQRIVTGSVWSTSGIVEHYMCRYETHYTSSWISASIAGQSWVPMQIDIYRGNTYTIAASIYNDFSVAGMGHTLGLPQKLYREGLQSLQTNTSGIMGTWSSYASDVGYIAIPNRNFLDTTTITNVFREDLYGPMNSFNLYWSSSLGVQLAVRDIYVVQIT